MLFWNAVMPKIWPKQIRFYRCVLLVICSLAAWPLFGSYRELQAVRQLVQNLVESPIDQLQPFYEKRFVLPELDYAAHALMRRDLERRVVYIMVLAETQAADNRRIANTPDLVGAGNWVLRRSLDSGDIEQIKIFLRDDAEVFLRITPNGRRSTVSAYLYGERALVSSVFIPFSIDQVFGMSLSDIRARSEHVIPWQQLLHQPGPGSAQAHQRLQSHANTVAAHLHLLPDAEDGAMDENGNVVFIENLTLQDLPGFNCSGFAKWIADGFYYAATGRLIPLSALKTKHFGLRGDSLSHALESQRDPWFGLDWTRNLSQTLASLQSPEAGDVRTVPFFNYVEDQGYDLESLKSVLYMQTVAFPGQIYLGSVNGLYGSEPELWQHYHVAVFFPYFNDQGEFAVRVFERNVETSIESLIRRYPGTHIHLVKIDGQADFQPVVPNI